MSVLRAQTVTTPDGPFTFAVDEDEAVVAAGWEPEAHSLLGRLHHSLRPEKVVNGISPMTEYAVQAYYDGDVEAINKVAVRQHSGPHRLRAWQALRDITPGAPLSYQAFAAKLGAPSAVRAAASACASNTVGLFVPCHRIIRTDGSLGGFRWGLSLKQSLLEREARVLAY